MARERHSEYKGGGVDWGDYVRQYQLHDLGDEELERFLIGAFLRNELSLEEARQIRQHMGRVAVNEIVGEEG